MTAAVAPKLVMGVATRYGQPDPRDSGDTEKMSGTPHLKATLFFNKTHTGAGISGWDSRTPRLPFRLGYSSH